MQAEMILVLNDGNLAGKGTHEELMKSVKSIRKSITRSIRRRDLKRQCCCLPERSIGMSVQKEHFRVEMANIGNQANTNEANISEKNSFRKASYQAQLRWQAIRQIQKKHLEKY